MPRYNKYILGMNKVTDFVFSNPDDFGPGPNPDTPAVSPEDNTPDNNDKTGKCHMAKVACSLAGFLLVIAAFFAANIAIFTIIFSENDDTIMIFMFIGTQAKIIAIVIMHLTINCRIAVAGFDAFNVIMTISAILEYDNLSYLIPLGLSTFSMIEGFISLWLCYKEKLTGAKKDYEYKFGAKMALCEMIACLVLNAAISATIFIA